MSIDQPIRAFNSIGRDELVAVQAAISRPLSGYLAGQARGGMLVRELEDEWAHTFHVKHAIAVNSATSGLLAAAFAIGLTRGSKFIVPAMTMSATAAAPMFTGAEPVFRDVEDRTFGLAPSAISGDIRAVFSTNLFGHAADPQIALMHTSTASLYHIEDNAQSPFAMRHGRYAGTIGHIGVFSLNVHKPLQCGEGGIVVTNNTVLAERMRNFINHGEHLGVQIGLNLRMPELCAAVALAQLRRGPEIINSRIEQAEAIIQAIGPIPGIRPPYVEDDCTHVYYTIPFLIENRRHQFCERLRAEGVPIVEHYAMPLYYLPALDRFATRCPTAEGLYHRHLFYIENCAWTFSKTQIRQIGEAFQKAAENLR